VEEGLKITCGSIKNGPQTNLGIMIIAWGCIVWFYYMVPGQSEPFDV